MSNPTFKPSEGKREEFRKYLEKNGVMDALTKVLVNLYEEVDKPEDALEYIRDRLAMQAGIETYNQMKIKQEELQTQINDLEAEVEQLKIANEPAPVEEEPVENNMIEGAPVGEEMPPETAPPAAETPTPEGEGGENPDQN